jgi:hypothetical protein
VISSTRRAVESVLLDLACTSWLRLSTKHSFLRLFLSASYPHNSFVARDAVRFTAYTNTIWCNATALSGSPTINGSGQVSFVASPIAHYVISCTLNDWYV